MYKSIPSMPSELLAKMDDVISSYWLAEEKEEKARQASFEVDESPTVTGWHVSENAADEAEQARAAFDAAVDEFWHLVGQFRHLLPELTECSPSEAPRSE